MTTLHSGITKKNRRVMTLDERQAYLASSSPIILHNSTIEDLKELQFDLPLINSKDTFDELIIELKAFRKKKGLGELWSGQ